MKKPLTMIVTSNKGGSGKTPISINLATWALTQSPPLKVLLIDINHTNQDLFQAMQHIPADNGSAFEAAFSLEKTGTAYYLPLRENLHLVRSRAFQPLTSEQAIEMITKSTTQFAQEKGRAVFQPDIIILDGNYCFPSYRITERIGIDIPPFIFLNIWSITSPHELRMPTDYRSTIQNYKDWFNAQEWDSTNFIHVFTVQEKERRLTSEMTRLLRFQRAMYSVPGSDDLADLYRKVAEDTTANAKGFTFDQVQREIFSPLLSEIDSLMIEEPSSYSEDMINARWVERINIFLTNHRTFPMNIFPLPHYYPFLRKATVDMILRDRIDLPMIQKIYGDFHKWVSLFMNRYITEYKSQS
ncbi:MAG: hypothetical protein RTU92_01430 [Candidatus Thorarchaeota archaeon]